MRFLVLFALLAVAFVSPLAAADECVDNDGRTCVRTSEAKASDGDATCEASGARTDASTVEAEQRDHASAEITAREGCRRDGNFRQDWHAQRVEVEAIELVSLEYQSAADESTGNSGFDSNCAAVLYVNIADVYLGQHRAPCIGRPGTMNPVSPVGEPLPV